MALPLVELICPLPTWARFSKWRSLRHTVLMRHGFTANVRTFAARPSKGSNVAGHDISKTRNIGIMAHIDAGKTTTTEHFLYHSGFIRSVGKVDHGDTVTDYLAQERERGITIQSAAVTFPWLGHRINLIDTPGHVDFTLEVERALRVVDGAVAILDASAGVEAQTLKVWEQAGKFGIPAVVFLNKMDKAAANISLCLDSIRKKLKVTPLLIQLPLVTKHERRMSNVDAIIDLINMRRLTFNPLDEERGIGAAKMKESELSSADVKDYAAQRESLLLDLAELDNQFASQLDANADLLALTPQLVIDALRRVTLGRRGVPVLLGAALRGVGVQPVMDAICRYLPSPAEMPTHAQHYEPHLCALAFKIIHDRHRGPLTFLRVYAGMLKAHGSLWNVNQNTSETCQRIYIPHADDFEEVQQVGPGQIAVVMGLSIARTGDTLTDSKVGMEHASAKIGGESPVLAGIQTPEPVFFCSIEPPSASAQVGIPGLPSFKQSLPQQPFDGSAGFAVHGY